MYQEHYLLITCFLIVIEVSSGEYGDVVPTLVKAWNAYMLENVSPGSSARSSSTSSNFKQMMVSFLPCAMKSENKSIFGGVSQLSQVSMLKVLVIFFISF